MIAGIVARTGVQIVGPYLHDRTVIAFARALAGLIGGFTPPPAYAVASAAA